MHAARRVDGPHHGPQTLPVSKKSDTDLSDTGAVAALSNWDPMAFDYHSKSFNSYVVGPGRTLSTMASGKKPCENALLYITNIPHTLTRQGLMNVCAKVQPRIISLDNKVRNPRNGYTRAVVAYRTIREAQDVMLALHMAEPLRLRVTFGQSIESRVNEASLRLHAKILKQQKEEEERRRAALATPYDFQPLVLNPGDLLGTDTRLELLDFAEDYYFSWKFQTGRGIFFPPRQPYLSWALKPLGTEVEHFRATMDLDVTRSRDQEFDVFGHFDLGLFDETTAVVAMVYEKHLKESGMGPRKIFGGRAFDPPAPVELSEVNCFEEEEDPLHEIVVGGLILNEGLKSRNVVLRHLKFAAASGKIGVEGKINVCLVCGGVTQSCCSTCFLPFCSLKCAEEHQGNHEDQGCAALRLNKIPSFFAKKKAKVVDERFKLKPKRASEILNFNQTSGSVFDSVPVSIMSHLCLEDKSAELVVQDLVSSFGESLGFTLIVCNRDAKSWIKQLRALRGDENEQLIQVEPNLGVGEMNSCVLGGKLCRILLRQDLGDGRWSCVLVDKGEVVDLPEHRIQPPVPGQNSVPRLSLFATVLDCEIDGLDLWTKVIQPKKKLKLVKMRKADRGTRILGDLHDGKGNQVCSVRISDWLPLRPKSSCVTPSLEEKEQVVISTFCSSNVCYVHRLNRFQELCMLQNQVNLLQFTESPYNELPQSGSIVAVKSSVDSRMYRAVVKIHTSLRTAFVFCLDFGNREEVALGQIFPLPATLAELPAEAILVQLADVPRQPLNLQCYMLWAQLVEQRQVLEAEMDQSGRFSLISTVNNLCVNGQLNEALAKEQENPGDGENLLPSPAFPLEEGKMLELLVLHEFGDSVTCTLASSPQVRHLLSTQVRQAAKYVAESTESTYVPTAQEVCLAKFTDELWYRALNVSSGKDWCDVMFIDFGNISRVGFSDMRKLPPSFNESPPLATVASLAGLREEDFGDPRVAKCIKQVLRPFRRATGLVLEQNAGQADIFFPELISQLHSEGLLSDERLHELEKKLPASVEAPWLKRQPLVDLLCDLGESELIGGAPLLMNSFCSLVTPGESLI